MAVEVDASANAADACVVSPVMARPSEGEAANAAEEGAFVNVKPTKKRLSARVRQRVAKRKQAKAAEEAAAAAETDSSNVIADGGVNSTTTKQNTQKVKNNKPKIKGQKGNNNNPSKAKAAAGKSGTQEEASSDNMKDSNGTEVYQDEDVEPGTNSAVPKKKNKKKNKKNKKAAITSDHPEQTHADTDSIGIDATNTNRNQNNGDKNNANASTSNPSRRNRNNNGRGANVNSGTNVNASTPGTGTTVPFSNNKSMRGRTIYAPFLSEEEALEQYASTSEQSQMKMIRGTLRVVPGRQATAMSFVTCDRGSLKRDVLVPTEVDRNRGMDGDTVYVQLYSSSTSASDGGEEGGAAVKSTLTVEEALRHLSISGGVAEDDDDDNEEEQEQKEEEEEPRQSWREDDVQRRLWDPAHDMKKPAKLKRGLSKMAESTTAAGDSQQHQQQGPQWMGKVVHIVSPAATKGRRRIVGRLMATRDGFALGPTNKSLPLFYIPSHEVETVIIQPAAQAASQERDDADENKNPDGDNNDATATNPEKISKKSSKQELVDQNKLYQATYRYGSWKDNARMPACCDILCLGDAFHPENETQALLVEFGVDHGEFSSEVLHDVETAVKAGRHSNKKSVTKVGLEGAVDLGWSPTPKDLQGRRDFRETRIFTIDPTTAKDLDDAVHVKVSQLSVLYCTIMDLRYAEIYG
jgi:exoribonuclease R